MNAQVIKLPIGILLMAYGGPAALTEIPGYLADIRAGRPTPRRVVEEITNNYRLIGGRSPLLEISRQQAAAVGAHFDPRQVKVFLGMRHWAPWIEDTVRDMAAEGVTHAISMVLAPHFSRMSVARYQQKIDTGMALHNIHLNFQHIDSYHTHPALIAAFTRRVHDALLEWEEDDRSEVHVVFSAHSLPVRIKRYGDPYEEQLLETASLIANQVGLGAQNWSWCYQSAGRSPEPWLGPQMQDYLIDLAHRGVKNIITVPIGFVSDHVEILYDIDIQAQKLAQDLGMRLVRPPALNTDPLFIQALVDTISARLETLSWLPACRNTAYPRPR